MHDPEQPFLIAFSVLDGVAEQRGGADGLTATFADRCAWLLAKHGYEALRRKDDAGAVLILHDVEGARLALTLTRTWRFADREQWRLGFTTTPGFSELTHHQRAALAVLHALLTELLIAAEEIEDVDVTARRLTRWQRGCRLLLVTHASPSADDRHGKLPEGGPASTRLASFAGAACSSAPHG